MISRLRLAGALGALSALALAPVGGAVEFPWPDSRHGWAIRCSPDKPSPRCPYGLYSTEDGGRRWQLIYRADGNDIAGFLRTSTTSGVLSTGLEAPKQYWTRNNGDTWYPTRHLPSFEELRVDVAGKGGDLFWSRDKILYEIVNWVPRAGSELRPAVVYRLQAATFTDISAVPRGVAAAILRAPGASGVPLARVLIGRLGSISIVPLPEPDLETAANVTFLELLVTWPSVTVFGEQTRYGKPVVVWRCGAVGRRLACSTST
jgi:hypothetical protein